jgi:plastocyanin
MADVGNSGFFDPDQLTVPAGAPFQIDLTNEGPDSAHNMRINGDDNVPYTGDDIVTVCSTGCLDPTVLNPGGTGQNSGTLTDAGTYDFFCDLHPDMTGTITAN